MWLLSKGRIEEAEKSLCWLRGWVPASCVQKELNELIRYSNASKLILKEKTKKDAPANTNTPEKIAYSNPISLEDENPKKNSTETVVRNGDVTKPNNVPMQTIQIQVSEPVTVDRKATFKETLADLVRPQMLKPLSLVVAFFFFHNGSGFPAMRPYMVNIFEELRFPIDAHWATVSKRIHRCTPVPSFSNPSLKRVFSFCR